MTATRWRSSWTISSRRGITEMNAPLTRGDGGGPAFPATHDQQNKGMTLRDYFAAAALEKASRGNTKTAQEIATRAYFIADAMLVERAKIK